MDSIEYLEPDNINGLNLYCYCGCNPIMHSDPSGHIIIMSLIIGSIIGFAVSGWSAVGLFAGTTALSFGAGAAQYTLEYAGTDKFSWSELFIDAGLTALQSMISFGLGAIMSSSGMWNSLGKGEFKSSIKVGFEFSKNFRFSSVNRYKSLIYGFGMYFERNGIELIFRTVLKNIFIFPYSFLKKIF